MIHFEKNYHAYSEMERNIKIQFVRKEKQIIYKTILNYI